MTTATMLPPAFAALLPHAPILIPSVGLERGKAAAHTTEAMRTIARRLVAADPERLVVVTPHAPRAPQRLGIHMGTDCHGSLASFGEPWVGVTFAGDPPMASALAHHLNAHGIATWAMDCKEHKVDHGAVVPLWFLAEAGWNGPTLVVGLGLPDDYGIQELGHALAACAAQDGRRWALIASGDMSHALSRDAPAGLRREGLRFDEAFIEYLREGKVQALSSMPDALVDGACEDALRSTLVALTACGEDKPSIEVLSYEGPFGVGYGCAVLRDMTHIECTGDSVANDYPAGLARTSIETAFRHPHERPPKAPPGLGRPAACFVTLHDAHGRLRGCIGTLAPTRDSLAHEIWHNARSAAFNDPRFEPLEESELTDLRIEVSVLAPPEDIHDPSQLAPARYGVIVRAPDGRTGVLLPDIPGIETVEEQLRIARTKGGISAAEPQSLQRFTVRKHSA